MLVCRCANPHDPHVSILKVSNVPGVNHEKRFIVSAFQFMDQRTNKYLNEEVSWREVNAGTVPNLHVLKKGCLGSKQKTVFKVNVCLGY